MKINVVKKEKKSATFADLAIGDVFQLADGIKTLIYMRVFNSRAICLNNPTCLESTTRINSDTSIIQLRAELIVTEV